MGLPLSPILCDIYMEDLEQRAIETAPHPPLWWFRYVDDTHCKLQKRYAQEFTDHLNSLDKDIKFTTEGEENNSLAFLDMLTVIHFIIPSDPHEHCIMCHTCHRDDPCELEADRTVARGHLSFRRNWTSSVQRQLPVPVFSIKRRPGCSHARVPR